MDKPLWRGRDRDRDRDRDLSCAFQYSRRLTPAFAGEGDSPFGGWRHHLSPSSRGDYGRLTMGPCLYRKA